MHKQVEWQPRVIGGMSQVAKVLWVNDLQWLAQSVQELDVARVQHTS